MGYYPLFFFNIALRLCINYLIYRGGRFSLGVGRVQEVIINDNKKRYNENISSIKQRLEFKDGE